MIETDSALYIVRLDSETDKDATEKNTDQNIIVTNVKVTTTMKCWRADGRKKTVWKVNKKECCKDFI